MYFNDMNRKKVMAFGTFDYLHAGHEHYLKKASELGDELIVVVARDRTAKNIRGKAPDHSEKSRLKTVQQLPFVTKAILGNSDDKYKVIRKHRPTIIALGYDQMIFTQQLHKLLIDLKLNAEIIRLDAYEPQVYKSSLIKKALHEKAMKSNEACQINLATNEIAFTSPLSHEPPQLKT